MERNTFDDGFDWLEKYFKNQQSAERRDFFWQKFRRDYDEVFCRAVKACCEKLKTFPTPEELSDFMIGAREAEAAKAKAAELANRKPLSKPDYRNTNRGRQWITGILEVCDGKITAEQLIERMGSSR